MRSGDILASLNAIYEQIDMEAKRAVEAVSDADGEVNRIYHEIEFSRFNARDGYLLAKRLQEALHRRRCAKEEQSAIQRLTTFTDETKAKLESMNRRAKRT